MRTFEVYRGFDESGVSGTGKVLEGAIFADGTCVVRWSAKDSPGQSTGIYDSFGSFLHIHVISHPKNKTEVRYNDGETTTYPKVEVGLRKPRRKRQTSVPKVVIPDGPTQVGLFDDARKSTEISQSEHREEIK